MTNKIKFIHTADIHLGRPLSYGGNPDEELLEIFTQADKKSLERLVNIAIREKVDFIVISGDLYDREARSVNSSRFFLELCQKLDKENIFVYIISGNHDPAGRKKEPFELPENVHFFSSEEVEIKEFKKNNQVKARILGQSYRQKFESRSMYNFFTPPDKSVFNLALLHTALKADSRRYVPVTKSELLSKEDIHYWALGHIHQYQEINKVNPVLAYSGTIQGRDINEDGIKGCLLLEVDQDMKIKKEFIKLAPIVFKNITIDISEKDELKNISHLKKQVFNQAEKILNDLVNSPKSEVVEGYIIRWLIQGRSEVNQYIKNDRKEIENSLLSDLRSVFAKQRPFLWSHSIVLRTADKLPELDNLKEKNQLFKELENLLADLLEDPELEEALLDEWGEIWQGDPEAEDRENDRFFASQDLKKEILAESEKIIISELIEGGD
ncbi:DNA repair exonuclease [Halanaerobium sp. Z-7514]|uniref:DNA repair exonuclease n=1 Tax=Halanaerobium polyolivorans TaxID=2886943 RepID=A0AAW4WYW8_9FIRM|nr:DNA repair exonuclease [Halanaerobium polyolivorans]MCC3143949.1 DNA repair exonuclease [Halanaerobium polyolivorans]RQD71672.1 MAG: DNA repair exonuclease [Halanaerobium sp. MSAO_Bac5]